jgi:hypothetical protein
MDSADNELLQFESLSPSGRYSELTQYCVGRLTLWLDRLLEGEGVEQDDVSTHSLLDRLSRNRRTLRNGYQFQLHKLFSDFKAIRPARLHARPPGAQPVDILFDTRSARIRPVIERIEQQILPQLEPRLLQLDLRIKYLVHRSDTGLDDNPLKPANLCRAFVAALETLDLSRNRLLDLLELYGRQIGQRLPEFCRQCDWSLSEQGIRYDLPFDENPTLPVNETAGEEPGETGSGDTAPSATGGDAPDSPETGSAAATAGDEPETASSADAEDDDQSASREDAETPEPAATEVTEACEAPEAETTTEADAPPAEAAQAPADDPETVEAPVSEPTTASPDMAASITEVPAAEASQTLYSIPDTIPPGEESLPHDAAANDACRSDKPETPQQPAEPAAEVIELKTPNATERISQPVRTIIDALKQQNEQPEALISSFRDCIDRLIPVVDDQQRDDLRKFAHFFSGLVENPHVSDPLRQQLLRLAAPLLYLVMSDPFFFRSSAHPVNDFLHSMIDFEIRHGHKPQNLKVLTLLIDNLLRLEVPVFSDFQPITQGYEVFKRLELERLRSEKKTHELNQEQLKSRLLEWVGELTGSIDIGQDALAFFYDDWKLYLLQVARQYGEDSNELQDAKELARMLAWSLNPERPENAHYASQRFTVLLREIDRALRSLDYPAQHRQRLRRILVREFRQANRPTSIYAVQPVQPATPAVQPFFGRLGEKRPPWAARPRQEQPELYPDVASLIQLGDLIEVKPRPGSGWRNPQRGKLRWQSTDGIYRFFNQRGSIILEIDADGLNRLFARGEASLLKPFSSTGLGGGLGSGFRIYR